MQNHASDIIAPHQDQFEEIFEQINFLIESSEFKDAANIMSQLHPADLADFLDNINQKIYKIILPFIEDDLKPETLVQLSASNRAAIILILGFKKSSELINQLEIEDAVEALEDLDPSMKDKILEGLNLEKRHQIIEGCTYPEDTVGRVIERRFIAFNGNWNVGKAVALINSTYKDQDFYAAIITDSRYKPIGTILLGSLLKYNSDVIIKDIMKHEFKITGVLTDLSELSFIFKQYALKIVPVVNKIGRLIGTVSIDNMIYIIEEQTEKGIMSLGGVHEKDTFYNLFYTVRHRFPWLFIHLLTACFTSVIINQFNVTISKLVTLAAIMPIVASMGGNAGTQAMTVTVRALANKDIYASNFKKVILKEVAVCGFNGIFLALFGAILCMVMTSDFALSLIFLAAVILTFIIAGFSGAVIPITLNYFNIDPATGSSVFLTTITDSFGFFTFLILAYIFIV